jgi:hypothetical protein
MAQPSEKVQKFLVRIGNVWPKRLEDDNIDTWIDEWEGALKQFDKWVIEAAATRIVHDRTQAGFPFPAEVRKVCFQVLADDRKSKPELQTEQKPRDPYALAEQLMRCELGKRAAREGWALTLRDFIAEKHRLPEEGEVRRLIQIRNEFIVKLKECLSGNGGIMGAGLADLGKKMVKREHEIARKVLGEQAGEWYAGKF